MFLEVLGQYDFLGAYFGQFVYHLYKTAHVRDLLPRGGDTDSNKHLRAHITKRPWGVSSAQCPSALSNLFQTFHNIFKKFLSFDMHDEGVNYFSPLR